MTGDRAIVVLPGQGRQLTLGSGLEVSFKVDEAEAEGRYALAIATVGPGHPGTTPHVHREHDDVFFVVEGTIAFEVATEMFEVPTGTFVAIPRGLAHRWWNPRSESAMFVNIHVPDYGFESFVRELSRLSAEGRAAPATMAELGAQHDVYFEEDVLQSRYGE